MKDIQLWLEIFSAPLKDQKMAFKTIKKLFTTNDIALKSLLIDGSYWFFTMKYAGKIEKILELIGQLPWSRNMFLYPHFSRPVLSYYLLVNGKENPIKSFQIPFKKTNYKPINSKFNNNLLDHTLACTPQGKIQEIPFSYEKKNNSVFIDPSLPKALYVEFFKKNMVLMGEKSLTYVSNVPNNKKVIEVLNAHINDFHEKIARDKQKTYTYVLGKDYDILKKFPLDEKTKEAAKMIIIAYKADRNSEIVLDYPKFGGLISGKFKEMESFWSLKVNEDKIVNIALFLEHLVYLKKAIGFNKLPTANGDPWSIKKSLRLLLKLLFVTKLPLSLLPKESFIFMEKYLHRANKSLDPMKLEFAVHYEGQLSLKAFYRMEKLVNSLGSFKKNIIKKNFIKMEKKIIEMSIKNHKAIEDELLNLLETHRAKENLELANLLNNYITKMKSFLRVKNAV